jgi:hypothetical protein
MATTTNYGWTTPDDTALVKDGAAAIRSLGTSVDTTTKNLNPETTLGDISYRSSTANVNTRLPLGTAGQVLKVNSGATAPEWSSDNAGMTNPMTTTGDTIYSSSGSTPARLAIGSTGNVLTVAGGVPTWAAPGASTPSFSLLSTTTLTGAATFTITGLSGYNTLIMIVKNASAAAASNAMCFRVNSNTSNVYRGYGININPSASFSPSMITQNVQETTNIGMGVMSGAAGSQVSGYVRLEACNGSGIKMFHSAGGPSDESSSGQAARVLGGFIDDTNVISSITFFTDGISNFDVGTLRIYGSVA